MTVYEQMVVKIIAVQEAIMGPLAIDQANEVENLTVDWDKHEATIGGDPVEVVEVLIGQYSQLFGRSSVEVSKDAVASLMYDLGPQEIPHSLRS